jgi:methylated-DNA-[protein]-cysteine S-methyltransferase
MFEMTSRTRAMQPDFVSYDAALPRCTSSRCFSLGAQTLAITLSANDKGLVSCALGHGGDGATDATMHTGEAVGILERAFEELGEYFRGERMSFSVPLSPEGTDFQLQVWRATCQIPYGQVRSYWWVAVRMGNPHAVRAVGNALSANPLAIFIPCHRVVRQDGALGGFRPGTEWKQRLLDLEQNYKEELYQRYWPSQHS